jgi:RND family efflux transporter MFP subunit
LIQSAARAALAFGDPTARVVVSPRVAELAEGVLRTMFVTKLKIVAAMVLTASVAAGVLTHGLTASPQTEPQAEDPAAKRIEDRKEEAKPISVRVVKPKKGGLPLMVRRPAEVVAAQQQQVVPLVSGTVKEVRVDIGDRVKKGQVLLVLDAPLLAKDWEQTTSAFEMAQAEEQEAEARVVTAEAEVQAAEAIYRGKLADKTASDAPLTRWKLELERLQKAEKAIRSQVLEETKRAVHVAEAAVAAAEAAVAGARADVKIKEGKVLHAKATLKAARAAVRTAHAVMDKARIRESFTQLTAAGDGVVTRRTIDPGNYVQPSDSRLLRPLVTVQRLDTVRIVVQVGRNDAPLIKRGMPVEIEMPGIRRGEYKISRFSPTLEGGNREMTVEIDVPNADNRLLPGLSVEVLMPLQETATDSLIVPSACLLPNEVQQKPFQEAFLFIVRDGKACRKAVRVRSNDGRNAEIAYNIQASDLVIIKNQGELSEGTPVTIEQAP